MSLKRGHKDNKENLSGNTAVVVKRKTQGENISNRQKNKNKQKIMRK